MLCCSVLLCVLHGMLGFAVRVGRGNVYYVVLLCVWVCAAFSGVALRSVRCVIHLVLCELLCDLLWCTAV